MQGVSAFFLKRYDPLEDKAGSEYADGVVGKGVRITDDGGFRNHLLQVLHDPVHLLCVHGIRRPPEVWGS